MNDLDSLVIGAKVLLTCKWYNGLAVLEGTRGDTYIFRVDNPEKCTSDFKPDHSMVGLGLGYPGWREQVLILANSEEEYNQSIEQYYLDLL
jgi:hypothetical protein